MKLVKILLFFCVSCVILTLVTARVWGSSQNQMIFMGPCDEGSQEKCELGRFYLAKGTPYFEGDIEECAWIYQQIVVGHKQLKHHLIVKTFNNNDAYAVFIFDSAMVFFGHIIEKSVDVQKQKAQESKDDFLYETDAGIEIRAEAGAVSQYENYWKKHWLGITWGNLDSLWEAQTNIQNVNLSAENLRVFIKEWKLYQYPDELAPKPRFRCSDGRMVQAYYDTKWSIYINLGIDDGQSGKAFCQSPLPHEWNHLILWKSPDKAQKKCKWLGEIGKSECRAYDLPNSLCK